VIGRIADGDAGWDPRWAPHLCVVADTGGGKSSLIRAILAAWRWQVVLLDPKRLEFGTWPERGRVLHSTGDPFRIAELLRHWADEVDNRMDALSQVCATHWTDSQAEPLGLQPVLIVIDEAMVALTRPAKEETEKETRNRTDGARQSLLEILVLGRACGVHVVVGLQRPDVAFLGGGVARDQLKGRVALGRLSPDGCRMLFDADVSEQMDGRPGFGLAVNLTSSMPAPIPFRSAWISPPDIRALYASESESR
jgi:S-DNA-T family DNA segregation ATPase FtsK/SpoIIIE